MVGAASVVLYIVNHLCFCLWKKSRTFAPVLKTQDTTNRWYACTLPDMARKDIHSAKKRCRLVVLLLLLPLFVQAESSLYQGFSGGMMLHAGYLYATHPQAPATLNGGTVGIGGAARVHLGKHLRVGGEGFVSLLPVGLSDQRGTLQAGSYVRNGWGGLLADAHWNLGRVIPFVGGTVGAGAQRLFYLFDGSQSDWQPESHALFHKQVYALIDPFAGVEIALTAHIHLLLRLDYALPLWRHGLLAPHGPRVYVGFMFCR